MSPVLFVPGKLTTTNSTRRRHWSVEAGVTEYWRDTTYLIAKAERLPRLSGVVITITPHQFRGTLADSGAHAVCVKAAIDGIVRAGVLPDDSPEYVLAQVEEAPVRATDARNEGLTISIDERNP